MLITKVLSIQSSNRLPLILAILGSILICIWPMQHTIALRNVLLMFSSILGLCCCWQWIKSTTIQLTASQFLPLILLGAVFFWIIFHYLFLAQDPQTQYQELRSTWLRCLLSVISGFSLGLVISTRPGWIALLAAGLFASFLVLYGQYLPKALQTNYLSQLDYFNYIFYGKHNAVLQGSVLLAFLYALALHQTNCVIPFWRLAQTLFILSLVGFAVLFTYVYMFDTRNGVGIAVILTVFAVMLFVRQLLKRSLNYKQVMLGASLTAILIAFVIFFAIRQSQSDPGWKYLLEDTYIAVQIDEYPNWQNPVHKGYPKLPSGRRVTINTYERFAWATVALRLILNKPLGNGVLHFSFQRALNDWYHNVSGVSASHSAWLELGLAFGLPALIPMIGAICILIARFWATRSSPFANFGIILGFILLIVYALAELIGQHGLEILFYWIAFLAGLQFWRPKISL